MPGTVRGAEAVDTFPISLSTKFVETRTCMPLINEYRDGSTQRSTLVMEARRSWSLAKRLTPSDLATLRTFWEANPNTAFGFYNPFETNPPFTRTPFGTTGYYLVRFASDWEETIGTVRSDVSVELVEVSANPAGAPATGQGASDQILHGATTSATLNILTSHIEGSPISGGAICSVDGLGLLFSRGWLFGDGAWTLRTDTHALDASSISRLSVLFTIDTGIAPMTLTSPEQFLIYDCWVDIVFADATASTLRPTTAATVISVITDDGTLTDPGNANDGDPSTFALIERTHINTLDFAPALRLASFR